MSDSATLIANLLYSYGRLVDAGDFQGIGRLFAHAHLRDESGRLDIRGAEPVTRLYEATTRRYPDTGTPKTQHVITNPIIEVDEASGRATCRSCYTVFQQTASLPLQPIVACRYATGPPEGAPSLHLHTGRRYVCEAGACRMVEDESDGNAVIVSSEALSDDPGWRAVAPAQIVLVSPEHEVTIRPLAV